MATKRQRLQQPLTPPPSAPIDEARATELARLLAPISTSYLRQLLRESGVPLTPTVEGVLQDSLENLVRTLCALAAVYPQHPQTTRALVPEAKAHAKLALRRDRRVSTTLRQSAKKFTEYCCLVSPQVC